MKLDDVCTHNKPYVAICTDQMCPRNDRRLCYECIEDHMCSPKSRIRLEELIEDRAQISQCITAYNKITQSPQLYEATQKLIINYQHHLNQALTSYELYINDLI